MTSFICLGWRNYFKHIVTKYCRTNFVVNNPSGGYISSKHEDLVGTFGVRGTVIVDNNYRRRSTPLSFLDRNMIYYYYYYYYYYY
jgi:hypothetical protein